MATQSSRMQRGKQPLWAADWSTILPKGMTNWYWGKNGRGQRLRDKSAAPEAYEDGGSWKEIDQLFNRRARRRRGSSDQTSRSHQIRDQIRRRSERDPEVRRTGRFRPQSDGIQGRRSSRPWHGGRPPPCKAGLYSTINRSQVRSLSMDTCPLTDNPVDPNHCLTLFENQYTI